MSEHSLLSPSGANRWLNCSGSILLPQFDDSDHRAADEGTLAHKIAEYKLIADDWYSYESELDELRDNDLYTAEMETDVDSYLIFINDKPYTRRLIEEMIDLSFIQKNFFGTADCILVDKETKTLEVIDFKYGRYKVDPEHNPQLMIYAIGAAKIFRDELKDLDDFTVKLSIFQPRIFNIATWETNWKDLCRWNSQILIPAVSKIAFEKVEENTGPWCRFCKAKIFCGAYNNEISFDEDETQIKAFTNEDIEENYSRMKETEDYLKQLKKYITAQIKEGKEFKNYKLVAGNKRKHWKETDKLKRLLKKNKVLEKVTEVVSPNELKNRLGEEAQTYDKFIELKEDQPLLVKKSDRRKELVFGN